MYLAACLTEAGSICINGADRRARPRSR